MSVFLVTVTLEDVFGVSIPNIVSPLTLMALPVSVAIAFSSTASTTSIASSAARSHTEC